MTHNLDLVNSANWSLAYTGSVAATFIGIQNGVNIYSKIPIINIPVTLNKNIIEISVSTTIPTGKTWKYGGSLQRYTNSQFGNIFVGKSERLLIGNNLLIFDDISGNYQITIIVPSWFISASLNIYQYQGNTATIVEQDLAAIETAVIPNP